MIVAVSSVHVVKMTRDEVVDMVTMRHRRMAAVGAVHVLSIVFAARVVGRASGRIGRIDRHRALVDVIAVDLVQVTIVEIVDMACVADGGMAAGGPMHVSVAGMSGVGRHMSSVG